MKLIQQLGRVVRWVFRVLQTMGAGTGRAGDPSARSLYEHRDEYRP